jgi:hypothetical protein
MSLPEPSGPDLVGVVRDANKVSLPYVVVGGFSVIANGYVRATKDSNLLVPDGADANQAVLRFLQLVGATRAYDGKTVTAADVGREEHLRLATKHGIVDIMRGGLPPLDFDTVARYAVPTEIGREVAPIAALRSIIGFKRLAARPRDRNDLEELEAFHGELPIDPIPGLDDVA